MRWCDRSRWKLGFNERSKTSKFWGLNSLDFMELLGFQIHDKYKRANNPVASDKTSTSYILNFNSSTSYDSGSAKFEVEDSRNTRTVQRFFVNWTLGRDTWACSLQMGMSAQQRVGDDQPSLRGSIATVV